MGQESKRDADRSFTIPASGNAITPNDIAQNQLRITVDYKKYFPSRHSDVTVEIGGIRARARLNCPERRSYRLRLGKEMMGRLGLKSGGSVKIWKTGDRAYRIERVK